MPNNTLIIVAPCYNEQKVLPGTMKECPSGAKDSPGTRLPASRILYVNDGSRDQTRELICHYHADFHLMSRRAEPALLLSEKESFSTRHYPAVGISNMLCQRNAGHEKQVRP